MVKLSIIILSFNNNDTINDCIESVLKYKTKDIQVIVLDNASSDKTVEILEKFVGFVRVLKSDQNLGFSKGINKAISFASGEYLFFLNPDTKMTMSVFKELTDYYESHTNIGVVGPKLITQNGNIQESVMKFPTITGALNEFILGKKYSYSPYAPEGSEPIKVDCIFGAALLIKRDLFEKLGGFDERYFLYYEDIDLCRRIRKMGREVVYYPNVEIEHKVGGSASSNKYQLNFDSSLKYNGLIKTLILQLIFRTFGALRSK